MSSSSFFRIPWARGQWQVSPPRPRSRTPRPRAPRDCIPAHRRTPPRPPNLPKRPRPGPQRLPPTSTPPSTLPARAIGEKAAAAGDGAGRGGAGRSGGGGNGGRGRPRGGRRTGGGGPRHPESQSEEEETFGAQLMMVLGARAFCPCELCAIAPAANGCFGTGGCVSGREGPVNCEL